MKLSPPPPHTPSKRHKLPPPRPPQLTTPRPVPAMLLAVASNSQCQVPVARLWVRQVRHVVLPAAAAAAGHAGAGAGAGDEGGGVDGEMNTIAAGAVLQHTGPGEVRQAASHRDVGRSRVLREGGRGEAECQAKRKLYKPASL